MREKILAAKEFLRVKLEAAWEWVVDATHAVIEASKDLLGL